MKNIFTLIMAIMAFSFSHGQYNVPLTNADVESNTPMTTTNNVQYTIDGMYVNEAVDGAFDETSSGLAPGEGVGSSQALKIVTQNSGSTQSWHTQFVVNQTDISGYGNADFIFSFQIKSATVPESYPIWMTLRTFDEDGTEVTANTVTNYAAGGKISSEAGVDGYTVGDMSTSYQTAWNSFTIVPHSGGGKNAKFVDLRTQMSKLVNTYYIDELSLVSSAQLSTKSFEKIGVIMYPNPVSTISYIKSNTPIENVSLYSVTGKLLLNKKVGATSYNLDVSSYSKGMYLLSVTNTKGTSTSKLIVD
ncbi:T9SS type A sorting domain-containing protein [Aestuariivivens sediminis]|uniref:T9SS type A sorting domain-containing protein n=1 Tax=Aestuariivivens sediminis TaxID=2913557 RepID=UPI001F56876D|nr:T9SS type A sorting domain-containing protein [Aestuariivivens sediminis]